MILCLSVLCACGSNETVYDNDTPEADYSERIVFTVGGCGNIFLRDIEELNASQDEFYFVAQNFKIDENGEKRTSQEAVSEMVKCIKNGDGPDLISVPSSQLNNEELAEVLVDLYPYIDSDPDLKRDDILGSLRTVLEVNDRLCVTASAFTICTMAAKSDVVGNAQGWNIQELQELSLQNGGAQKSFSYVCDGRNFLDMVLRVCGGDYFEGTKLTEADSFFNVLTYCKQMGTYFDGDKMPKGGFFTDFELSCYMDVCYAETLLGGEISWIGVPGETRNGHAFWTIVDTYAITSCCSDIDAAWKFLRTFFTEEYQYAQYVDVNAQKFPSNIHALLRMKEEAIQGTEIDNEVSTPYAERCVWEANYHSLTENQADLITNVLTSCDKKKLTLYDITVSCGMYFDSYFAEELSLEETIEKLTIATTE